MSVSQEQKLHDHSRLYRAVWRWHFYSGLFVIPFLLMLALTGAFMMIYSSLGNEFGWVPNVAVSGPAQPVSAQAQAALSSVPGGKLLTYIMPEAQDRPAFVEVGTADGNMVVAIDPYTSHVTSSYDGTTTWRSFAERIHGTFLLGTIGDRLIEIASSLAIILVVTGVYMWWPQGESLLSALVPNTRRSGRSLWRELHKSVGIWMSLFLVLFIVTGLAWAGIWGEKYVQPWSSFPAEKYDNVPLSDVTHASMNHNGQHDVPWALEQTPLPASGSLAGTSAITTPVTIDKVAQWASENGYSGQYRISLPGDEKGVFTVSYDGRNEDGALPSNDRFVHFDQFTGRVLADIQFAAYKPVGKLMAWGIALHKGMAGPLNFAFNLFYLASVVFLSISGVVMWWKRRPTAQLAAPLYPRNYAIPKSVLGLGAVLSLAFPMGGAAVLAFAVLDFFLPKRLKEAGL